VKQAVAEIKKVARKDPVLAAGGAILFLERVSPALCQVDSSSGAIGSAVNNAIAELVPIIVNAEVDAKTRDAWLERLWDAYQNDQIPYIEVLADHWGDLCGSKEVASRWADRLGDITRMALNPDKSLRGYFHGTSVCLSALFKAERNTEIVDLLQADVIWPYKRWAVKALSAQGKKAEAIRYAESSRSPWASNWDIDQLCEEILLSSGMIDEAYVRYGLTANRAGTYLATFRAIAKKYPHKAASEILADLVKTTPGDEGKWFAAAKSAGFLDIALQLATSGPCDPHTLTRAARDHAESNPEFAMGCGLAALRWIAGGYGYEISGLDVMAAYTHAMKAAEAAGQVADAKERIRQITESNSGSNFVAEVLGKQLVLPWRAEASAARRTH